MTAQPWSRYSDLGSFSDPRGESPRAPYMDALMAVRLLRAHNPVLTTGALGPIKTAGAGQGGVKLTNLYVMPLCSPTRAALLVRGRRAAHPSMLPAFKELNTSVLRNPSKIVQLYPQLDFD